VISNRKDEIVRLHAKYTADRSVPDTNGHQPSASPFRSDAEIVERARSEKNGKFERLWQGDTAEYGHDHSAADDAFVHKLWPYTQDEKQIRRIHTMSGLHRPEKSGRRSDYLRRSIDRARKNVTFFYEWPGEQSPLPPSNGHQDPASPSSYKETGRGRKPEVIKLAEVKPSGPRRYVLEKLVLAAYVTLIHGDGGVAKSLLALALAVAVAGDHKKWLGRSVENGPVLYLDFELDAEEQARRVQQICRGLEVNHPSDNLLYMSALGFTAREAFEAALIVCEEHGVKLMVVDSYGIALEGDAEASRDVIGFHQKVVEPFRATGVAVLMIDHQSRLQTGQSYKSKSAFGSVYKTNLARSVIQIEATDRGEDTLTVRLRQKKHNFGPLVEPFGVKLSFSEDTVHLEAVELEAAELAEEQSLNSTQRVKLALEDGPAYPQEISDTTGLAPKTVKNVLTPLRKQGIVKPTGEKEMGTEQVQLSVPASPSYKGDEDGDGTK